jgi:hypothetical protein
MASNKSNKLFRSFQTMSDDVRRCQTMLINASQKNCQKRKKKKTKKEKKKKDLNFEKKKKKKNDIVSCHMLVLPHMPHVFEDVSDSWVYRVHDLHFTHLPAMYRAEFESRVGSAGRRSQVLFVSSMPEELPVQALQGQRFGHWVQSSCTVGAQGEAPASQCRCRCKFVIVVVIVALVIGAQIVVVDRSEF